MKEMKENERKRKKTKENENPLLFQNFCTVLSQARPIAIRAE
jgi:hypothetical protein